MVSDLHHHDDYSAGDALPRRELDVGYLGRRLKMQKRWLFGPALLALAASAVAVNLVAPRYTAETKVLIGTQDAYYNRQGATDTQQPTPPDEEAVQSQVQLVSSRDLARQAIKTLGLKGNAEFDRLADGLGPVSRLLVLLGLERDPLAVPSEERILPVFSDHLTVFPVTKSRVLTIEFESKNPDLAARAANTVADLYLDIQSSAKRDAAHQAAESLRTLVADLRSRAAEADAKAQSFRSQSGLLLGINNAPLSSQQLTDMSTQLAQANSAEADAQAKARLIRDMVKDGRLAEVPDVANNDLMRKLSEQRAAIQAEVAQQARTLLPGHPRMQELSAQLHDLDGQLRTATDKVVRSLDSDARIAQARVENLTAAINAQKQAIGATGADQVKLSDLDLTAKLLKDQLEFNTAKYQEALARENVGANPADARIISRAVAPPLPSFPKKLPIMAIATIAGLVLSLGILIARELLSGRAFAAEVGPTRLPVSLHDDAPYAALPLKPSLDPADPTPAETDAAAAHRAALDPATPDPVIAAAEAARMRQAEEDELAPALLAELAALKQADHALRVLLLDLGAAPVAGPLALKLGRALSRTGRVIAVDLAGMEAERVAAVGAPARVGLADLIGGRASFAEVIHRDPRSRLHLIAPGAADTGGHDQDAASNILDALAETYDDVLMSGLAATGDVADLVAGEHADVLVLASDAAIDPAERDACRSRLRLADDVPVLTAVMASQAPVATQAPVVSDVPAAEARGEAA